MQPSDSLYYQPSCRSRTTGNHISAGKGRSGWAPVVGSGWGRQEEFSAAIGDRLRIGFRKLSVGPAPLAVLIRGSSPAGRTNRKEIFRPDPLGWRRFPGVTRLRISSDRLLRRFPGPGPNDDAQGRVTLPLSKPLSGLHLAVNHTNG